MIRRFNRDTGWLATGVLGTVAFAALLLAVQERHPKANDLTERRQAEGDPLLNPNPATRFAVVSLNGKSSTGKIIAGKASSVDYAITQISPKENPSSQVEAAAPTPTPIFAFTSEINQHDMQANAGSWTPAHRHESGRVIELKLHRASSRSSVRPRSVDVKMRLIALWHQSLARREKSHSWIPFSTWNAGDRKKVSYTRAPKSRGSGDPSSLERWLKHPPSSA